MHLETPWPVGHLTEPVYEAVLGQARTVYCLDLDGIHGPSHWRRVERFGIYVGVRSGADIGVVRLFARLHDSMRLNDDHDPDHGHRAVDFAGELRTNGVFHVSDEQFRLLEEAMRWHNDGQVSRDPTIGTCWDADRLDLERVGIVPDVRFLSTAAARDPRLIDWAAQLQAQDGACFG